VQLANAEVLCTVIRPKNSRAKSPQAIRTELVGRLRERRPEIDKVVVARIRHVSEPASDEDPAYVAGVHSAVAGALDYGLEGLEKGAEGFVPIPDEAAKQARRAARDGVRLDTVLRRYAAGNKSLEEFIMAEAEIIPSQVLCQILSDQGLHVDRLMESVAAEYRDELEQTKRSSVQKEADRIVRLLESDSIVNPVDLNYDFDSWHIGMILMGHNAEASARVFAERLGCRSLHVARDRETAWAWLSSTHRMILTNLEHFLVENESSEMSVAVGEPRKDLEGWRQTFHEAQAAQQVMLYRPQRVTRCRDVILISAILRDQSLAASLIETYLTPLDGRGDSGEILRTTLRAYFRAGQNSATAAADLGVHRNTVVRRLQSIEQKLDQSLDTCNAQLQVALGVEDLMLSFQQDQQFARA
jgi:PucR-like helix-turn-helix protein/diguanylate cyclase with GGDEF domain